MSVLMTCPDCGHVGRYRSQALADFHFPRHSCANVHERKAQRQRRVDRAKAEGVKRDCQCKRANHQHGTSTAYVVDGCRCRECTDANTTRAAERRRQQLYGRYDRMVDATEAREHLHALQAAGMGPKRICEVSGIAHGSISAILYGKPSRDPKEARKPRKRITRDLHERIMAVKVDLAPGVVIDGTGTARRLQALVAVGWSQSRLATRLGLNAANFNPLVRGQRDVLHGTAKAVRALYDELWDRPPAAANRFEQGGITRALGYAGRMGWCPPMAWDDDTIDDPTAAPDLGENSSGALVENLEWLLDSGYTRAAIADRIGVKADAIRTACQRAGRVELWGRYRDSDDRRAVA